MSSDEDIIKVSLNKNNNGKDTVNDENDKISLLFVDSIFKDIKSESKAIQDPLNAKNNSLNLQKKEPESKQSKSNIKTPQKTGKTTVGTSKLSNIKPSKKPNNKNISTEKSKNQNKIEKKIDNKLSTKNTNTKKANKVMKNPSYTISENFLAKQESEKEKKLYEKKVKLLENRILALKKQEEDANKKKQSDEMRQKYLNKRKKEKSDFKQQLLSYDIDKRNALEERRKAIKEQKSQLNTELRESMRKAKIAKIKNYKKILNEKKISNDLIHKNNKNFELYGRNNVNKIKKEREDFKMRELKKQRNHGKSMENYYLESCEGNKQETDKLKDKLLKLEKIEAHYINNIIETKKGIVRNNSTGMYLYKRDNEKMNLNEQEKKKYSRNKYSININKNLSYDDNLNEEYENEAEDIIKVEKKMGLNNKK